MCYIWTVNVLCKKRMCHKTLKCVPWLLKMYQNNAKIIKNYELFFAVFILCFALLGHRSIYYWKLLRDPVTPKLKVSHCPCMMDAGAFVSEHQHENLIIYLANFSYYFAWHIACKLNCMQWNIYLKISASLFSLSLSSKSSKRASFASHSYFILDDSSLKSLLRDCFELFVPFNSKRFW